ncbi:MAG: cation diffusion facilitator family transporter [Firmicutes bacterium]|nr:cation diffusion facilitator family transporter [Bacillota bacterium]
MIWVKPQQYFIEVSGLDSHPRYNSIRTTLILVLILNLAVALTKAGYGYLTNSVSMLADGFHSLFDGTSNVIGLAGIYIASKPADLTHPYGHAKYETIASLGIGVLLSVTAIEIFMSAYHRIFSGTIPEVTTASFVIMLITMAINLSVTTYEGRRGKQLKSELLISDAKHTRSDIYVSLSVIASLVAVKLGFPLVDVVIAFIIAGIIGYMAISVFKESSDVLCDARVIENHEIHAVVSKISGVHESHAIRTRGKKSEVYVDLHIVVDPKLNVDKAHDIASKVEEEVKKSFPDITDVLVHVEPHEH